MGNIIQSFDFNYHSSKNKFHMFPRNIILPILDKPNLLRYVLVHPDDYEFVKQI